ncbi:MAG: hypothetical protein ACKOX4_09785, partial [Bacteroidota bacterium]
MKSIFQRVKAPSLLLGFWGLMGMVMLILPVGSVTAQTYAISTIPFSPMPYAGASLTGEFSQADDGVAGPYQIGFSFCYFGNNYTQFWVGTNGWISFSPGQPTTYTSAAIPSAGATVPKNCVMGPWQDWWSNLNGNGTISYQTVGSYPNRKLVV